MTLRDVGAWIGDVWSSLTDGLHVAMTEAYWDWPLWLSIPVGIIVPWLIIWLMVNHVQDMRNEAASIWGTIGFGVGATVFGYVTYDVWIKMSIFEQGARAVPIMRFGYPIMALIFGFAFFHGVSSLFSRKKQDDDD